jgi:hypothetical protein
MALARDGGNKETQRPMALLVERLSAIVETFAARRMRSRERSFLAEAKEESLLSILTDHGKNRRFAPDVTFCDDRSAAGRWRCLVSQCSGVVKIEKSFDWRAADIEGGGRRDYVKRR